jgi:hypothetical protein
VLLLLAAITIHTGFEGGSLGRVEQVSPAHFRCHVAGQSDQDGRNRQADWYYFRVDGAKGQQFTLDLVSLPGEYNYRPTRGAVTKDTIPVFRDGGGVWKHFPSIEFDAAEPRLRVRITPASDRFWVAHVEPYTLASYTALMRDVGAYPALKRETIGKSVESRELPLLTIGSYQPGGKVIWLMFRQHAWETGSSWVAEGAIRFLLSKDPAAGRILQHAVVKIFPYCDPDGMVHGGVRFNLKGYDLNRNWDVDDPVKMPEIHWQKKAMLDWVDSGKPVDLFLSLHNTETGEYLEGPPGVPQLMSRFEGALARLTSFAPTRAARAMADTTTPGKPGRMNVGQGLWNARKLPAFLMEQMIAHNPKLGRLPAAGDRKRFGAELVQAMFAAVE